MVLIIADLVTTHIALSIPGIVEGNPTSQAILNNYGILGLDFNTVGLVLSSFSLVVVYTLASKKIDKLPRKSDKDRKVVFIVNWLMLIVCFAVFLVAIIVRLWVVVNNLHWIISLSHA